MGGLSISHGWSRCLWQQGGVPTLARVWGVATAHAVGVGYVRPTSYPTHIRVWCCCFTSVCRRPPCWQSVGDTKVSSLTECWHVMNQLLMMVVEHRHVAGLLFGPYHFEWSILQCRQLAPGVDLHISSIHSTHPCVTVLIRTSKPEFSPGTCLTGKQHSSTGCKWK